MKRTILVVAVVSQLIAANAAFAVQDAYQDTESHPLRVAAYVLHPVGVAAEWLVFRPFHFVVAQFSPLFGHEIHGRKPQS